MTSFLPPMQAIKRIWDEIQAIKARLNAISTAGGQVRSAPGSIVGTPTAHKLLSTIHSDSLPANPVRGDLIVANATPAWARLAKPTLEALLFFNTNDPAWADFATQRAYYQGGSIFIEQDAAAAGIVGIGHGSGATVYGLFQVRKNRGSISTPGNLLSGDILGQYSFLGWGSGWRERAYLRVLTTQNWTASVQGCKLEIFTTPDGAAIEALVATFEQSGDLTIPKSLVVGANAAKSNASVGIEVQSTTKAFLTSRMTTTERDALTPLDGMIIYNTTLAKFQGYEAGAWANLI